MVDFTANLLKRLLLFTLLIFKPTTNEVTAEWGGFRAEWWICQLRSIRIMSIASDHSRGLAKSFWHYSRSCVWSFSSVPSSLHETSAVHVKNPGFAENRWFSRKMNTQPLYSKRSASFSERFTLGGTSTVHWRMTKRNSAVRKRL